MESYRHGATDIIVEAVQLTSENSKEVSMWTGNSQIVEEIDPLNEERSVGLNLKTPDGIRRVSEGQYIVKQGGNFFVIPPTAFRLSYTPVDIPEGLVPKDVRDSKILRSHEDET